MDEKKRVTVELRAEIGDAVFFLADAPNGFRGKIPMHGKVVGYHLEADKSQGTELMTAVLYAVQADGDREGDPYEVPGSLLCATAAGAIAAAQDENLSRWAGSRGFPNDVEEIEINRKAGPPLEVKPGVMIPIRKVGEPIPEIPWPAGATRNVPRVPEGTVEYENGALLPEDVTKRIVAGCQAEAR